MPHHDYSQTGTITQQAVVPIATANGDHFWLMQNENGGAVDVNISMGSSVTTMNVIRATGRRDVAEIEDVINVQVDSSVNATVTVQGPSFLNVGDTFNIVGVTGALQYNRQYTVVSQSTNAQGVTTIATNVDSTGFTGTPNFANARIAGHTSDITFRLDADETVTLYFRSGDTNDSEWQLQSVATTHGLKGSRGRGHTAVASATLPARLTVAAV